MVVVGYPYHLQLLASPRCQELGIPTEAQGCPLPAVSGSLGFPSTPSLKLGGGFLHPPAPGSCRSYPASWGCRELEAPLPLHARTPVLLLQRPQRLGGQGFSCHRQQGACSSARSSRELGGSPAARSGWELRGPPDAAGVPCNSLRQWAVWTLQLPTIRG